MTRPKARRPRVTAPVLDRFAPLLDAEPKPASATFTVQATVWRYTGAGGWHFATLPAELAAQIRDRFASAKRGWGSIPVQVSIGKTQWQTSLFPARKARSYLFAIKADVRRAEGIADGSRITAQITVGGG